MSVKNKFSSKSKANGRAWGCWMRHIDSSISVLYIVDE